MVKIDIGGISIVALALIAWRIIGVVSAVYIARTQFKFRERYFIRYVLDASTIPGIVFLFVLLDIAATIVNMLLYGELLILSLISLIAIFAMIFGFKYLLAYDERETKARRSYNTKPLYPIYRWVFVAFVALAELDTFFVVVNYFNIK